MNKTHISEAQDMFDLGHTFYACSVQINMWYGTKYTPKEIGKNLKCDDNPVGHKKFKGAGWK